jgi:hypothetical protein
VFPRHDHRGFRPAGWVEAGRAKFEAMRPIADRHGLTMLQLACHFNLAHGPVHCVAPTLIEEAGSAKSIEAKRAELAAVRGSVLSEAEVRELRAIGDNTGSMTLKGAAPDHQGASLPDRWGMTPELSALAGRWGIEPARDLTKAA